MREVACADDTRAGDAAPANRRVAANAARSVLVILLPKRFGPAESLAKAVPAAALAQRAEKSTIFCEAGFGAVRRPGAELPGAAEFAGLFTVH